jgi:hypothetical protein
MINGSGNGRPLTVSGGYTGGQLNTNVVVNQMTITKGLTGDFGGGAAAIEATLTLVDCLVVHNQSAGIGGGLYANNGGVITLTSSTLADNSNQTLSSQNPAFGGGGVAVVAGSKFIATNSEISNNSTDGMGGGLLAVEALLQLTNVSIFGNSAGLDGGGLSASQGAVQAQHVLVLGNTARNAGGADLSNNSFATGGNLFSQNSPNDCNDSFTCPD